MLIACSCLGSLGMLTTNYRRATQGTKASLKFRHKHIQTLNMFMHTHLDHRRPQLRMNSLKLLWQSTKIIIIALNWVELYYFSKTNWFAFTKPASTSLVLMVKQTKIWTAHFISTTNLKFYLHRQVQQHCRWQKFQRQFPL
jgi:hypothetical protein